MPASLLRLSASALAIATVASGASAQQRVEKPAPPQVSPTDAESEIVVTATRRETGVNDVPSSIQALGTAELAAKGSYDFNSFAGSVTGLSALDRGPGQQLITMRGVSSDTSATNTDAPESKETTAIYFDETPVSLAGFNPDLQLVDIDRIEALKGPQGTLFGAGALAGVVRIIGKKPDLDDVAGSAELEVSDYAHGGQNYAGNAVINLPFVQDKAALRVVGYNRSDGGFVDNVGLDGNTTVPRIQRDVNSANTAGIRGQLRLVPTDAIDLNFKIVRQLTTLDGTQNVDRAPLADGTANTRLPSGTVLGPYQQYRRGAEPYRDGITILNLDATIDLEAATLVSSTSIITRQQNQDIDFSGSIPVLFGIAPLTSPGFLFNATRAKNFVQEVRLVSANPASRFQWIVGGFYDRQRKSFEQDLVSRGVDADNGGAFGSDNLLHTSARFRDRQFAAFGELSYRIADLTATAGLRYFDFKSVYSIDGDGAGLGGPLSLAGRTTQDNGFNPKFNLSYKANRDLLIYAQAARGFRLGGINDPLLSFCSATDQASFVPAFRSDKLWNYEAGAKVGWFGGKLQTNLAVYRIDWSDVPISRSLACGVSNTITAGKLKIEGLEFDASARIMPGWRLSGGFSYNNSRITAIDPAVSAQTGIVAGERAAGTAPWNANLSSSFSQPLSSGDTLYVDAGYYYTGSIFNYPGALDPRRIRQAPFSLVNARLGIRHERWDISLFVNNAFGKRAILFQDRILGESRDTLNRPRTIGLNAKTGF